MATGGRGTAGWTGEGVMLRRRAGRDDLRHDASPGATCQCEYVQGHRNVWEAREQRVVRGVHDDHAFSTVAAPSRSGGVHP